MKLGSCRYAGQQYVLVLHNNMHLLPALSEDKNLQPDHPAWRDMQTLIEHYDELQAPLAALLASDEAAIQKTVDDPEVELLAPIPRTRKNVICLGLNYLEHAEETAERVGRSAQKPEYPIVFTKAATSIIGHNAVVPFDEDSCSQLDWEAEMGLIIGKAGRKLTAENAMDHVFGYTVINDLSARDLQFNHKQFFLGKSLDGGCPMGPYIVTADEIADPHTLNISCRVNGVIKQDSNTRHMIFDIPTMLTHITLGMTLEAGDVIATGTPSGVGFVREPAEFLRPGDTVECEVENIGILRNRIA